MKKIYAIRDRLSNDLVGQFPLVAMQTDAQAVRYFGDSMQVRQSAISAHPDDYELLYLGMLEDDGKITAFPPSIVVTGTALLATQDQKKPATPQLELEA